MMNGGRREPRTIAFPPTLAGRRAFSLVELLVVVAIIAILASMLLTSLSRAKETARRIKCTNNLRQLAITWQLYADDHEDRLVPNGAGSAADLEGRRLWVVGNTHQDVPAFTNREYLLNPKYAAFADYLKTAEIYKCPSDHLKVPIGGKEHPTTRSYALNGYLAWEEAQTQASLLSPNFYVFQKGSELSAGSPSSILQFVDTAPGNICHSAFVIYLDHGLDGLYYHLPSVQHGGGGTASFADGHVDFHEWRDPDTTKTARDKWIPNHFTIQVPRNQDLRWLKERASSPKSGP
jgi:prepilin-type N-terminal cleavage/methylation domain-containing protein/prepilin-type processing-associated H-X9-DG protein